MRNSFFRSSFCRTEMDCDGWMIASFSSRWYEYEPVPCRMNNVDNLCIRLHHVETFIYLSSPCMYCTDTFLWPCPKVCVQRFASSNSVHVHPSTFRLPRPRLSRRTPSMRSTAQRSCSMRPTRCAADKPCTKRTFELLRARCRRLVPTVFPRMDENVRGHWTDTMFSCILRDT